MIRLHLLGLPHTITNDDYTHCPFTRNIRRFSPMMQSRGFEVYHYGIESSVSCANKNIDLLTIDEWKNLKIKSLMYNNKKLKFKDANDKINIINEIQTTELKLLNEEFNKRLRVKLIENYRNNKTDIICLSYGNIHYEAIKDLNFTNVEISIGYSDSYEKYRIFVSKSWLYYNMGKQKIDNNNNWFFVPSFHDIDEFKLSLVKNKKRIGYLGRIKFDKGLLVIIEIAKKFPNLEFVICGQGDPKEFLILPNIIYKPPIKGSEVSDFIGSCCAILCPSSYLEPCCYVAVESQLCGVPVISTDNGGFVDNIENFKTGLRCHTLADYCYGIQMALDDKFDSNYIRKRAIELFDMYKIAFEYEKIFKKILSYNI
jgi:glycosyltransferase involved in cell wall biosynthesis